MVSPRQKVLAIEEARRALVREHAEAIRPWAYARIGTGVGPELLRRALRELRGLVYRRDKYDAKKRGAEVVKHPLAVISQRGADCEDLNVFTLGAVMHALGERKLASVYLPSVKEARHVRLGVDYVGYRYVADLVEPAFVGPYLEGEWVAWNL